jgi:RND family efflux transporter MFP subunit
VLAGRLLLLPLALLTALPACNRSQAEPPARPAVKTDAPAASTMKAIPITVGRSEARTVQRTVETSGSLLAWEEVQARSELPGTIARVRAELGDRVTAGQVLADYDRREFELAVEQGQADLAAAGESLSRAQANVAAAEAQLRRVRDSRATLEAEVARVQSEFEWARSELERAQQLFQRQLIAARDVDSARNGENVAAARLAAAKVALAQHPDQVRAAEAQLDSDRAAVKTAAAQVRQRDAALGIVRKRLNDTTVRAPIAGFIARRHVSGGEFVKDNTALFTIVIAHPLKYTGTIPERFAPALKIGQPVKLAVEAYPGREFTGSVLRLAPAVDVQTRTLSLEARVPNESGALRPGFFARGTVLTQASASSVFVPADAVTYVAGLSKVFVVGGSAVKERLIRPGGRQGPWIEILEGVQAGETVATSNLPALFDGAPVTVTTR